MCVFEVFRSVLSVFVRHLQEQYSLVLGLMVTQEHWQRNVTQEQGVNTRVNTSVMTRQVLAGTRKEIQECVKAGTNLKQKYKKNN